MLVTMGLMQGSLFEKGSEEGSKETSVDFVWNEYNKSWVDIAQKLGYWVGRQEQMLSVMELGEGRHQRIQNQP